MLTKQTIYQIISFIFISNLSFNSFSQNTAAYSNTLLYHQTVFDSDTCCWRKLANEKKYLDAANLIVLYLKTNNPKNKHSLHWHAGQMFAFANEYNLAKKYFKRTYHIFYFRFGNNEAKCWYYYAKGTVAFLDQDKKTLEKIISIWRKKLPTDKNYAVLNRLNENWGMHYETLFLQTYE